MRENLLTPAADALEAAIAGRCIYCDERCSADAYHHDYCRDEHESKNGRQGLEPAVLD